jgi:drug/metabolite transporter (DMT)-like permease
MAESRQLLKDSMWALGAVALWGLAFPLIQIGLEDFSPILLGFLRFALASAILFMFVLIRYRPSEITATVRREWKSLLALGVLYVTIPNITQNMGLEHGTSSIASVIQSSGPVMTLIFAVLLLKERMTKMKGIGTIIAMAGTVLLVVSGGLSLEDEDFVSNVLILISATSYGLAWVSAKRMIERNSPILVIGLGLVFGTILLGLAVPFETDVKAVYDMESVVNLAVLGIFCAGLSSVLYLSSLEREEVSRMAFLIYLMPVFASVFAWVLMDQGVEAITAVCGAIIVVGIIIANQSERPDTSPGTQAKA